MQILIRRYHFALIILMPVLLSVVGVFTLRHHPEPPVKESLPPIKEVVPAKVPPAPPALAPRKIEIKKSVPAVPVVPVQVPAPSAPLQIKRIAFTFDDGPHPGYTERILALLADYQVPATFFLVGKQVQLHPALVERIFHAGHEIANHSYNHPDLRKLTDKQIAEELDKTHALIEGITAQKMKFFRPPGGQYNDTVVEEASKLGYTMALWTVLPQDHARPEAKLIQERVLRGAANNGIVLLHSGIESTLEALPAIFEKLKEDGYEFVTLSDLQSQTTSAALVRLPHKDEKNPGH